MPGRALDAKYTIPPSPRSFLERPRLHAVLDQAWTTSVTVVRGAPDSGKTGAVASWARQVGDPVAWLSLDEHDADPPRLGRGLLSAIHGGSPSPWPEAARGEMAGEPELLALLGAITSRGRNTVLVLDRMDHLTGPGCERLLEMLVRYMPPTLHLVTTGCLRPALPLRRLRLAQQLVEVGEGQLRLRPAETAALLELRSGLDVPRAQAVRLHEVTEGYLAAVVLAADELRSSNRQAVDEEGPWLQEVFAPVLDQLRSDLRRFVLETAPLEHLDPALCDAVTGRRDSADRLAELDAATFLLVPLGDGRRYRYHHLLRSVLLQQLAESDPELVEGAHRSAAHWMEAHGDPIGAIDQWLAVDAVHAERLIARHLGEAYFAGHIDRIRGWVERLRPPLGPVDPMRALNRSVLLLMAGRQDEASRWANEAEVRIGDRSAPPGTMVVLRWVRGVCQIMAGELDSAVDTLEELDTREVRVPFSRLAVSVTLIDALAQLDRFDEARRSLREMAPSAPFEGQLADVLLPAVQSTFAVREGRLHDAMDLAHASLDRAEEIAASDVAGTEAAHLALGVALLERGQLVDAVGPLLTAVRVATRTGLAHVHTRAVIALSRARALLGERAEAFHMLEAARRAPGAQPVSDLLLGWLATAEARLLIAAGDPEAALALLDRAGEQGGPQDTVLRAWAALRQGDRALTQDLLAPGLGPRAPIGLSIEAELLGASSIRDARLVQRHMRRAVHLGAPDGYLTVFLEHRSEIADALRAFRSSEPSPYLTDVMLLLDLGRAEVMADPLTERELSVVGALRSMKSTDSIAADLGVSPNTLKTHVKAVYRKLDAANRSEAVRRAVMLRLIGPATTTADLRGSGLDGSDGDDLQPELLRGEEESLERLGVLYPRAERE